MMPSLPVIPEADAFAEAIRDLPKRSARSPIASPRPTSRGSASGMTGGGRERAQ
jgi:hypothetical protein